jgi:uroporphyrinogen-III decarboxylase
MLSQKENYLRAVRGEAHEWVPYYRDACQVVLPDWYFAADPVTGRDIFGIEWVTNEFGRMPNHQKTAMTDISQWKDTVRLPDLDKMDWAAAASRDLSNLDPEKAKTALVQTDGVFLLLVDMMGWVDGLCTLSEEPEAVMEFNEAITDFFVRLAGYEIKYYKPDVMCIGDDLAAGNGPFISKETFREMYRPFYLRLINLIHGAGLPVEFHCCGRCDYLVEEFMDMGIDVLQLPRPTEELKALKKKYGSRLVINGGWNWQGPGGIPGATEAQVRRAARGVIDDFAIDGGYIFWDGDMVGKSEDMASKIAWVADEVRRYGRTVY